MFENLFFQPQISISELFLKNLQQNLNNTNLNNFCTGSQTFIPILLVSLFCFLHFSFVATLSKLPWLKMADASLYFEEAVAERELEPIGENLCFTHAWVIRVPDVDEEQRMVQTSFGTNYKFGTCEWEVRLRSRHSPFGLENLDQEPGQRSTAFILVETARYTKIPGGSCHIAYTIYYDNDMRYEMYSSPKVPAIGMVTDGLRFRTPPGNFMKMLTNAFIKNEGKKVVVYIEMILPTRFFFRRFEDLSIFTDHKLPEYPAHIEDDFRFDFINNGDYTIKCVDGDIKASRQALFISSLFFQTILPSSHSTELTVQNSVDAVKPIIWYFHSLCFEMPETYELDYIKRIMDAIEYFHPVSKVDLMHGVHRSLCQKLANESSPSFDMVLQMASIATKHRFQELKNMSCSLLANEFYGKFKAVFPHGEQNIIDPRYRDIFVNQQFFGQTPFDFVEKVHRTGFRTNLILP